MMRIVAGAARGRRLVAPKGFDVRPTTDRVKEALFSSLQPLLPGARVLDLYAGSGGLGLEALSRGAAAVTFVERAQPAVGALRRNIDTVDLPGTEVVVMDAAKALASPLPGSPFDLVLADPPYRLPAAELGAVLEALVAQLAPGAAVVIERAARDGNPPWPDALLPGSPRRYGDTALHRAELPRPSESRSDP
ncbi:16S rRNA (guanine(966)-N(2))-methyltransferase RsmD [Egicoccus sp. AB-alg6-2]|uniref:16S rRNA (guanine(966)-N(2))-methyltransferase RsmD n=1 Tax=Egicoccus sp. AB-alg6-2 TaxID=3242692 RepID=UPI00359EBFE0